MKQICIELNKERNVSLTGFLHDSSDEFTIIDKRPSILVLPGGGYTMCSERECDSVAYPYLTAGYQVFILRYSIGHDAIWPNPLKDLDNALSYIRNKENEWNIFSDKIAVVGFSAGGHLAGCGATMLQNKPNAAILVYAALDGEHIQQYHPTAPDVISSVSKDTCPCFLATSRTDNMVPVLSTVKMTEALAKNGISFESHIYSFGPHGFSVCNSSVLMHNEAYSNRIPHWVNDSIGWLKEIFGDFKENSLSEPLVKHHINGNYEKFLNIDCTIGHLMQHEEAQKILGPLLSPQNSADFSQFFDEKEDEMDPSMNAAFIMNSMTLRDILSYQIEYGNPDSIDFERINTSLGSIRNEH